jgi:hypothetical protein
MYRIVVCKIISHHEFHAVVRNKLIWATIGGQGTNDDRVIWHRIVSEIEEHNLHGEGVSL